MASSFSLDYDSCHFGTRSTVLWLVFASKLCFRHAIGDLAVTDQLLL